MNVRDWIICLLNRLRRELIILIESREPLTEFAVDDYYVEETDGNDYGPAMRRVRDLIAVNGGGQMVFRRAGLYPVSTFESSATRQAVCCLSVNNMVVKGQGKSATVIQLPPNLSNRNVFVTGDPAYNQQTNRVIVHDVTVRDLTIDLNNAKEFCTGINFDTPIQRLNVISIEGIQSGLREGEPPNHTGDSWLVSFARSYPGSQAGTANDYDQDIEIVECDSYDQMQLTANLGGIQRMRIAGCRVTNGRNNGIAVTGVDHRAYIEDLVIENNFLTDIRGRAIWVGLDDSPSRTYFFNNGFDRPFCGRNIVIRNNTIRGLTPGSAGWLGILCTTYPKGIDKLQIYGNTIEELTETTSAAIWIRSRGFNEPAQTISGATVDLATDTVPCDTTNLGEGTLVNFKKASGATLPSGILDGKPYFLKPIGAQGPGGAIELYSSKSSLDVLSGKVDLYALGSGDMTMTVIGGFSNVSIRDNVTTAHRSFRWNGVANGTVNLIGNTFTGRMVFEQGHINDGLVFRNMINGTVEIDGPLDARRWWWRQNWGRRRRSTDNSNNSAILSLNGVSTNYAVSFVDDGNYWECFTDGVDTTVNTEPIYCVAVFDVAGTVTFTSFRSRGTGSASRAYRIDQANLSGWDGTYNLNRSNDEALGIKDPQPFTYRQKHNVTFDSMLTGAVSNKTVNASGLVFTNRGNLPVKVTPAGWSQAGDVHVIARVTSDGVITLTARNLTAGTVNPTAADFWLEIDGRLV